MRRVQLEIFYIICIPLNYTYYNFIISWISNKNKSIARHTEKHKRANFFTMALVQMFFSGLLGLGLSWNQPRNTNSCYARQAICSIGESGYMEDIKAIKKSLQDISSALQVIGEQYIYDKHTGNIIICAIYSIPYTNADKCTSLDD